MNGGSVESTRWIDNEIGGTITGYGGIKANLFNQGEMILEVHQPMIVDGSVHLSGKLGIDQTDQVKKDRISVIQGKSIDGRFDNGELSVGDKSYAIKYSAKEVYLVAK
jgi:hypothetical protein